MNSLLEYTSLNKNMCNIIFEYYDNSFEKIKNKKYKVSRCNIKLGITFLDIMERCYQKNHSGFFYIGSYNCDLNLQINNLLLPYKNQLRINRQPIINTILYLYSVNWGNDNYICNINRLNIMEFNII
jgi:hypothetical protein